MSVHRKWQNESVVLRPPQCHQLLIDKLHGVIAHAFGTHITDFPGVTHKMHSCKTTAFERSTLMPDVLDHGVGRRVATVNSGPQIVHALRQFVQIDRVRDAFYDSKGRWTLEGKYAKRYHIGSKETEDRRKMLQNRSKSIEESLLATFIENSPTIRNTENDINLVKLYEEDALRDNSSMTAMSLHCISAKCFATAPEYCNVAKLRC